MQIAAMNPLFVQREDVPKEMIDREMEIYRTQARNEKKPENIVERMAAGKLEKYYQDVCLIEQSYIKDSGKTIKDIVLELTAKTGEKISIRRFKRFHLGENG
jgi:elongation factor Ts